MKIFKSKRYSLKFGLMLAGIIVITLLITFQLSFFTQSRIYERQCEQSIQYVADYLEKLVKLDDEDFLFFQDYFIEHHKEYKIPVNFDLEETNLSREKYETLFAQQYPGMVLGKDISFDELSKEVKDAYAIWNYEYYRLTFEEAAKSFNIAYAYYLVPTGESEHMYWFLDVARDSTIIDGEEWLALCLDVHDPVAQHQHMWEAWETGKKPSGYDTYDDTFTYGMTYAYYSPLFINDQKLGVIGVEVEIKKVNNEIFKATIYQLLLIAAVLVLIITLLMVTIRSDTFRKYISLEAPVPKKSDSEPESKKTDAEVLQDDSEMNDELTGVRNKLAFDKEVQKLEWEISCGCTEVGVAVADMVFLKQIKEKYGDETGDKALVELCNLICNLFVHSPVFRGSEDEFIVILKNHDLSHIEGLVFKFNNKLKELKNNPVLEEWERLSSALGYEIFNPRHDTKFEDLLKRAYDKMNRIKNQMTAE